MPDSSPQTDTAAALQPEAAVEIIHLDKTYKGAGGAPDKHAVKDVSLTVPRGSFFGLLGPNGAGKSTMINIMAGLVRKTSGTVKIWGYDIDSHERQARCAIGVVPQELNMDPFFTPREAMNVQAGLYGVPPKERRTDEILDAVGLLDKADTYSRSLSGGMRRRLLVAKAMVHQPPILVLDEPTAGVDIELRQNLWTQMKKLNEKGVTILLTTHYLEEAEELCDQIAIVNHGRVVAHDTTERLLSQIDSKTVILTLAEDIAAVPEALQAFQPEVLSPRRVAFNYHPSKAKIDDLLHALKDCGLAIADIETEQADLEDIFLQMTRADTANRTDI